MIKFDNFNTRKIKDFLKEVKIPFNERGAVIRLKNHNIELPFNSSMAYFLNQKCSACTVDCYKRIQIHFNNDLDKEIGKIKKIEMKNKDFTKEEIEFLSRVLLIYKNPMKFLDVEEHEHLLEKSLTEIFFTIIGGKQVGKSTIFDLIPGKNRDENKEFKIKINETFPPLILSVFELKNEFSDGKKISPYIQSFLKNTYMFIIVSNSTTRDVMHIKESLNKDLKQINPSSLQICIANKQDNQHVMRGEAIENLTNLRTYELIATDPKCKERLINILFETILLRIEQMKENHCFLFSTDLTTTSQL
ncbi:MAG: hypothetical protein ACTSVY_03380 [Candidatus Helarchaeota archaeon]